MTKKAFRPDVDAPKWKGGHSPYDIIKEGTIALTVILVSPCCSPSSSGHPMRRPITIKTWSNADPVDFVNTALSELNGTSTTASTARPTTT